MPKPKTMLELFRDRPIDDEIRSIGEDIAQMVPAAWLRPTEVLIPSRDDHLAVKDGAIDFWPRDEFEDRTKALAEHGTAAGFIIFGRPLIAFGQTARFLSDFDFSPEAWAFVVLRELASNRRNGATSSAESWRVKETTERRTLYVVLSHYLEHGPKPLRTSRFDDQAPWHRTSSTDLLPGYFPQLGPTKAFGEQRDSFPHDISDLVVCRILMCLSQNVLVRVRTKDP